MVKISQSEDSVRGAVDRCKGLLERNYGERLAAVVLYGSAARGEMDEESDIDLLVVLREPFDYFGELRAIVETLDEVQWTCPWLISAKPAGVSEYESGATGFYRNVRSEAVPV